MLITENNESVEHIIPNALGGRLKSKKLLCKTCNSKLGELYDSELCNKLNTISACLEITREKGNTPPIKNVRTENGKLYYLENGRNPIAVVPEIAINEKEKIIHISARNEKELKHIIKRLKKKYPGLDDKDFENKVTRSKYYMDEALHIKLDIGGKNFMKAIAKIAINFYLMNDGNISEVKEIIDFLKTEIPIPVTMIRHYYGKDSINHATNSEVAHSIYIKGSKANKLLFAYVEIYSSCAFVINLNTLYNGSDIELKYSYDVLTNSIIDKKFNIEYRGKLEGDLIALNEIFIDLLQMKMNRVMNIADNRQTEAIINEISKEAIKNTLDKYPPGTILTNGILLELTAEIKKEAGPFIKHLRGYNQKIKN